MGDGYERLARKGKKAPRDVDLVEWAMLLALFLVGLTALAGKIHPALW